MTHQPRCGSSAAGLTLSARFAGPRVIRLVRLHSFIPLAILLIAFAAWRVGPVVASGIASPRARHVSAHGAGWHLEGLQGCDRPAVGRRGDPPRSPRRCTPGNSGSRTSGLRPLPGALASAAWSVTTSTRWSSGVSRYSRTRPGSSNRPSAWQSGYLPARVGLAEATFEAGALDESRPAVRGVDRRQRAAPSAELGLGRLDAAAGDHNRAIAHFDRAIALFPEFGAAYYGLALSYRALGRTADAERALAQHAQFGARWPALEDPLRDKVFSAQG